MLTLLALLSCTTAPPQRPNVLLVTMDTTRADALGVYGNTRKPTPNLDRFATSAVRFTRASTVTPLTIPTHSSIFTGLWPPRHGVRDNGDFFLGDGAVTLAERLHEQGYATMASVGAEVTSHHWGFSQGFDAFYDDMGQGASEERQKNRWRVERRGDEVLADALPWLQAQKADKPWFAWVHLFDAHHPYEAPEPYASEFEDLPYLAEVAYVDSLVGQLLADLEARGELDRTWVILMADHGEGLGSHGEMMHGVLLYDATTRIPLMVRPPGGRDGRTVDFPVSVVDITPTVLGAAGLPAAEGIDGLDLGPWLAPEPAPALDRDVYVESLYAFHHYGWAPQRALVDSKYKLIDSTTDELYLRDDALERTDVSGTDGAVLTSMQARVQKLADAMLPVEEAAGKAQLSGDRMAQLEALGYVTGDAVDAEPAADLPDPVKKLPSLKKAEDARAALRRGDVDGAMKVAEAVLAEDPGLAEVQLLLASLLVQKGEYDRAVGILDELDAKGPSSSASMMRGAIAMRRGDLQTAADALRAALELDAYLANAWASYLTVLFLMGDPEELDREASRGLQMVPDEPPVVAMAGIAAALRGDTEGARTLLERALAMDPTVAFANHGLGVLDRRAGDAANAEAHLLEEARLHPPGNPSRHELVSMYAEQKRYGDQLDQLDLILAAEPASPLTLHARGQALFNLQRYDESLKTLEACRTLAPGHSGCALLQANALKKLGRDSEAAKAFEAAKELHAAELAARSQK